MHAKLLDIKKQIQACGIFAESACWMVVGILHGNTRGRWRNAFETRLQESTQLAKLQCLASFRAERTEFCVCSWVISYSWLSIRFISSVMLSDGGASSSEVLGSASISELSSSDTALRSFLLQQAMAPCKQHARTNINIVWNQSCMLIHKKNYYYLYIFIIIISLWQQAQEPGSNM